jgi:hypothetical protein
MRVIPVTSFSTYYKPRSPNAGANAWDVRWLVWWAKDDPAKRKQDLWIRHPGHPSGKTTRINSGAGAQLYSAEIMSWHMPGIRKWLGLDGRPIAFVPVPSSSVTQATSHTGRWSGREIGRYLQARGDGRLCLPMVNHRPIPPKAAGNDPSVEELYRNYRAIASVPRGYQIVYLDDTVTWGSHLAALDLALGEPEGAAAICIACTDSTERDAFHWRLREVQFTWGGSGPTVVDRATPK